MSNALLLIDIQQEYTTPGRDFYLNGVEKSLENCRRILAYARDNDWDVIHIQHSNGGKEGAERFLPGTVFYEFAEGFEPLQNERHFIKADFSCYSSPEFAEYMNHIGKSQRIFMIGYNSVMCCLSTLEVARDRKHQMSFVADASLAKAMPKHGEGSAHDFMVNLYRIKKLGEITNTENVLLSGLG